AGTLACACDILPLGLITRRAMSGCSTCWPRWTNAISRSQPTASCAPISSARQPVSSTGMTSSEGKRTDGCVSWRYLFVRPHCAMGGAPVARPACVADCARRADRDGTGDPRVGNRGSHCDQRVRQHHLDLRGGGGGRFGL